MEYAPVQVHALRAHELPTDAMAAYSAALDVLEAALAGHATATDVERAEAAINCLQFQMKLNGRRFWPYPTAAEKIERIVQEALRCFLNKKDIFETHYASYSAEALARIIDAAAVLHAAYVADANNIAAAYR